MKPLWIALPVLWAGTLLAVADRGDKQKFDPTDPKKVLAKLQGNWLVVGAEVEGKKIPPEHVKQGKQTFVVKGETMTYRRNGKVQVQMKIILDPKKTPTVIHLAFTDGKEKGQMNHAIYQLHGNMLKLRMNDCFGGNSPDEQPMDFSTTKGKEAVLFILKRAKK
jgi:uncharacterized protein (TIGR03067 family)